jgi:hypothetical protein
MLGIAVATLEAWRADFPRTRLAATQDVLVALIANVTLYGVNTDSVE